MLTIAKNLKRLKKLGNDQTERQAEKSKNGQIERQAKKMTKPIPKPIATLRRPKKTNILRD